MFGGAGSERWGPGGPQAGGQRGSAGRPWSAAALSGAAVVSPLYFNVIPFT